ncbi:MAG: ABC transporter permease [Chitinophagaceae bacterium]|jgi:ABC-type transport system involved in multi-copper enzyme maturation permease subunit
MAKFQNIIRTEWLKLKNYLAFWLLLLATAISYPGINAIVYFGYDESTKPKNQSGQLLKMLLGNPFHFPEVYHTTAYLSSFFTFIPAIVVIMLITNEYQFKTHRQNIIDGWQKQTFIWGKFISVLLISILVSLFFFAVATGIGFIATPDTSAVSLFTKGKYIGLFFLQIFTQLSFAFLLGLLVRKAFIAYGLFIFYGMIVENIAGAFFKIKTQKFGFDYGQFLPLEISDRLIPIPAFIGRLNEADYKVALAAVDKHIIYSLVFLLLTWILSFYIFKKRDL